MIGLANISDSDYYFSMADRSFHAQEYYSEQGRSEGTWSGGLAEKMGLQGDVSKEDFQRVGDLTRGSRLGLNITYSPPKDVSVLYTVNGDKNVLDAHRAAVEKANDYIEKNLLDTRQGPSGIEKVAANGAAIANFEHYRARPSDGNPGDPQLHTHSCFMNAVERSTDGKITAMEPRAVYQQQKNIDQIYKSELASQLQVQGYKIEMTDRHGNFKVGGVDEKVKEAFSERREELLKKADELRDEYKNANEAALREVAAKASRDGKQQFTREEFEKHDTEKLEKLGLTREQLRENVQKEMGQAHEPKAGQSENYIREAASSLHESESVIHKTELLATASKLSLSEAASGERVSSLKELESAYEQLVEKGEIKEYGANHCATEEMAAKEKEIIDSVERGKGTVSSISDKEEIDKAISGYEQDKGFALTDGQKAAVNHVLTTNDRVIGIQGDAGAGKTTSFEIVSNVARDHDLSVRGMAPTGKAAEEMGKTMGNGQTVDSFLKSLESGQIKLMSQEEKIKNDREWNKINEKFESREWKSATIGKETAQSELRNAIRQAAGQDLKSKAFLDQGTGTKTIIEYSGKVLGEKVHKTDVYKKTTDGNIIHTVHRDLLPGTGFGKTHSRKEYTAPQNTIAQGKEVWVHDESSMLSSQNAAKLSTAAEQCGARLVMVGDSKQLQAVGAGKIFNDMQKQGMATVRMNESIRQVDKEYRESVKALSEKQFDKAKDFISKNTTEVRNAVQKQDAIRKEYNKGDYLKTHVVCGTNAERAELNQSLRSDIKEAGKISGNEHSFQVRESRNLGLEGKMYSFNYNVGDHVNCSRDTAKSMGFRGKDNEFKVTGIDNKENKITLTDKLGNERQVSCREHGKELAVFSEKSQLFAPGDKVVTLKNDKGAGLQNGQVFVLKRVDVNGNMTLGNDKGTKNININNYNYIDHGYASTVHKSQGMTVDKIINSVGAKTDYNKEYTSITRGKEEVKIFASDKEIYMEGLKQEHEKRSTLDYKDKDQGQSQESGKIADKEKATDRSQGERKSASDDRTAASASMGR